MTNAVRLCTSVIHKYLVIGLRRQYPTNGQRKCTQSLIGQRINALTRANVRPAYIIYTTIPKCVCRMHVDWCIFA